MEGDGDEAAEEEKKEKTDGGKKLIYGNFKHLNIRKSGLHFHLDRMDKNPDLKQRAKFGDKVTFEIKKECLMAIERREKRAKEK